jgi:hypothetical protein
MAKFLTMMGMSAFLIFSGVSVFADQSDTQPGGQSHESPAMKGKKESGSSIESKNPSNKPKESEEQREARPGGVGEEDPTTSMFGSPSTMPPSETSPGYTGADKEAEKMDQRIQEDRSGQAR